MKKLFVSFTGVLIALLASCGDDESSVSALDKDSSPVAESLEDSSSTDKNEVGKKDADENKAGKKDADEGDADENDANENAANENAPDPAQYDTLVSFVYMYKDTVVDTLVDTLKYISFVAMNDEGDLDTLMYQTKYIDCDIQADSFSCVQTGMMCPRLDGVSTCDLSRVGVMHSNGVAMRSRGVSVRAAGNLELGADIAAQFSCIDLADTLKVYVFDTVYVDSTKKITDTVYVSEDQCLNYGDDSLMSFIPGKEFPDFDVEGAKAFLDTLTPNASIEENSWETPYSLSEKGSPFELRVTKKTSKSVWENYCSSETKPEGIREKLPGDPQLNTLFVGWKEDAAFKKDSTVTWKLFYESPRGVLDSMEVTTFVKVNGK